MLLATLAKGRKKKQIRQHTSQICIFGKQYFDAGIPSNILNLLCILEIYQVNNVIWIPSVEE
jgi:hypothetical protein